MSKELQNKLDRAAEAAQLILNEMLQDIEKDN